MTRPGPEEWASNANWAGGPDVGSPTKVPPSAAEKADGYYRERRPSPQIWNYERWATAQRVKSLDAARVLNIFERFDLNTIVAFVGNHCDGCWDPIALTATFCEEMGVVAPNEFICRGGLQPWAAGAGFAVAPAGAANNMEIAIDPVTQDRGAVVAVANPPGNDPYASVGYAAFAPWGGGAARDYRSICHTQLNPRWIFGDAIGQIRTSAAPGAILAAPAGAPGFAAAPVIVRASNHAAADVYPDDPGNDSLIALTTTECSISNGTGNFWSAAALHGIGSAPWDAAYSKWSGHWLAACSGGVIAASTDNGATWAVRATLPAGGGGGISTLKIDTNGFGLWVVLRVEVGGGGDARVYASWDDGFTWREVFAPSLTAAPVFGTVFYGGGQFHIAVIDNGAASYIYTTLRAEE